MTAGILSERRAVRPFGLLGGGPGAAGLNLLVRADGRTVNLGAKATIHVGAGDRLQIHTPGAGGYGAPESAAPAEGSDTAEMLGAAAGAGGGSVDDALGAALKRRKLAAAQHGSGGAAAHDSPAVMMQQRGSVHDYRSRQETV